MYIDDLVESIEGNANAFPFLYADDLLVLCRSEDAWVINNEVIRWCAINNMETTMKKDGSKSPIMILRPNKKCPRNAKDYN